MKNDVRVRLNFNLTAPEESDIAVGANFEPEFLRFKACGVEVAKLAITFRSTVAPPPPQYSIGLEATILGRGKLQRGLYNYRTAH